MDTLPVEDGFVYLLHFEDRVNPDHPCRHYVGWARDLAARIQAHQAGGRHSARLMQVVKERGIRWRVARVWRGGRGTERQSKNQHNAPRLCPICRKSIQPGLYELTAEQIDELLLPF